MRADTKAISIDAPAAEVMHFLADPSNLPRWAVGFAKSVRRESDGWSVETTGGRMAIRIRADEATGVVDFLMSPQPGIEILAASRVVPRGRACEYVFTQFQSPGMPDEAFRKSVQALQHELKVLKAIAEVECPL
ncbi:MAG TPA: SRPBCC family protein [Burkholderiales bacterium]|jgi:hypothetical protein|nr:SRPBCC family protein [Burkholderiales bacterium]